MEGWSIIQRKNYCSKIYYVPKKEIPLLVVFFSSFGINLEISKCTYIYINIYDIYMPSSKNNLQYINLFKFKCISLEYSVFSDSSACHR